MFRVLSKAVMSHIRDIQVIHTIDRRVFYDIPLYFDEKRIEIKDCRVENGRIIVIVEKMFDKNKDG